MNKKTKTLGVLIAIVLMLSAFSVVATIPKASAWGTSHSMNEHSSASDAYYNDFQTFNRVYSYVWDGGFGIPHDTAQYPETVTISGSTPNDLYVPYFGHINAYLIRYITVWDENGNSYSTNHVLNVPAESGEGGSVMQSSVGETVFSDGYYSSYASFSDGMYIGSSVGLTYASQDFWDNALPQAFQHYKWDIQYSIVFHSEDMWNNIVETCETYLGHITHDERSSTNNLYNWELSPESYNRYPSSVSWSEEYPSSSYADASSLSEALSDTPNGQNAYLGAWNRDGALARVSFHLNAEAYGALQMYCSTPSWCGAFILVYVSGDGSNWREIASTNLGSSESPAWRTFGGSTEYYNYVLVVSYCCGNYESGFYIDAMRTGQT